MLRSIATVSISGTLPESCTLCGGGVSGWKFSRTICSITGTPAEIRQLAADLGLKSRFSTLSRF